MGRTRLFHSVVIVGAGLLANCGKHASPPAAGSATKPADAAPPADSALDAAAPADAAIDAPVDAGTPPRHAKPKPKTITKPPPDHVRIMVMRRDPPKIPVILEGQ